MNVEELLRPILQEQEGIHVGWPDEEVEVSVRDVEALREKFRTMLIGFRAFWDGAPIAVWVHVIMNGKKLSVRVVRMFIDEATWFATNRMDNQPAKRTAKRAIVRLIPPLYDEAKRNGGGTRCADDGSFFDLYLPVHVIERRQVRAELDETDWESWYRSKLERTAWDSLRREVYRFGDLATTIAAWSVAHAKRVLIPSVGLCVHPWLFAHTERSVSVIATDISPTAIETVKHPERTPLLYGLKAKESWNVGQLGLRGGWNDDQFDPMPDIADEHVVSELRPRIDFRLADWADLPIEDRSIDIIFATNALPRDNTETRRQVLDEWARVLRPGGFVFSLMHNAMDGAAGTYFESLGWQRINALDGERPPVTEVPMFQEYLSSG